jgi:hypothetical protein
MRPYEGRPRGDAVATQRVLLDGGTIEVDRDPALTQNRVSCFDDLEILERPAIRPNRRRGHQRLRELAAIGPSWDQALRGSWWGLILEASLIRELVGGGVHRSPLRKLADTLARCATGSSRRSTGG